MANRRKSLAILLAAFCWWSAELCAQVIRQQPATRAGGAAGAGVYSPQTAVGNATFSIDPETRRLIVITDDDTNLHIEQVIRQLDQPKPQVLINVVFLEVTYRDDLDFGIEGRVTLDKNRTRTDLESVFGLAGQLQGGFIRVLSDDFQVTLRAIAEAGKLEVLSRPSILTRNNQEAIIVVGQEVPFIRNTQITFDGRIINTVEYEDIGIILRVTPFIRRDGLVEMIVYPEISTITGETIPISETLTAPVFAKRAAETVVVTQDGQTVVIGGLMENNKTESIRKVPLLGDIPGLGLLFRRTIKTNSKTELLIFLTPHIVYEPGQLAQITRMETERTRVAPQAFSQEELGRFLENLPEETFGIEEIPPVSEPAPPRRQNPQGTLPTGPRF
jgi:type II secretory pathway component GspD/PulD (secretin)